MTEPNLQRRECENCDEVLVDDEPSYFMKNISRGKAVTICRRCYQTSNWEEWQLSVLNPLREVDIGENLKLAYDRVFTGNHINDGNLRRFYYREIPKLPIEETSRMLEIVKDLFTSIRPLDQYQRRTFQDSIFRRLKVLGLAKLCLWSPSADDEGLLDIDWTLLKTAMDCAVVYIVLEDMHRATNGPIENRRLLLSSLLRQPTAEETAVLNAEYQRIIELRRAETMRLEAEKYAVGHDVATFNRLFVENFLKDPQNLHRLLKVAYFHGNMHSCKECTSQNGECPDCYSRDTEFDMAHDDTLGTVWQQTVDALGGKKPLPVRDDSDGEEDDE